jgi:hypothetical protein
MLQQETEREPEKQSITVLHVLRRSEQVIVVPVSKWLRGVLLVTAIDARPSWTLLGVLRQQIRGIS